MVKVKIPKKKKKKQLKNQEDIQSKSQKKANLPHCKSCKDDMRKTLQGIVYDAASSTAQTRTTLYAEQIESEVLRTPAEICGNGLPLRTAQGSELRLGLFPSLHNLSSFFESRGEQ
jgi:hypothetical protein